MTTIERVYRPYALPQEVQIADDLLATGGSARVRVGGSSTIEGEERGGPRSRILHQSGHQPATLLATVVLEAFLLLGLGAYLLSPVAFSAPSASMNAYFQSDFKDAAYQKVTTGKVMKTWKMPESRPSPGKKTVVQSAIGRNGKLIDARVTMKSGSKEWDEAALAAVRKAAPFAALPASYKAESLQVHWHFTLAP